MRKIWKAEKNTLKKSTRISSSTEDRNGTIGSWKRSRGAKSPVQKKIMQRSEQVRLKCSGEASSKGCLLGQKEGSSRRSRTPITLKRDKTITKSLLKGGRGEFFSGGSRWRPQLRAGMTKRRKKGEKISIDYREESKKSWSIWEGEVGRTLPDHRSRGTRRDVRIECRLFHLYRKEGDYVGLGAVPQKRGSTSRKKDDGIQ